MRRSILFASCIVGLVASTSFAGASVTIRVGDDHRCHSRCRHNRPVANRKTEWKWFHAHGGWVLKHREIRFDAGWHAIDYGPWHIEFTGSGCYHAHGRWFHCPGGHHGCDHHQPRGVKYHPPRRREHPQRDCHDHASHHRGKQHGKRSHAKNGGSEVHIKYEYEGRRGSYEYEYHKVDKQRGHHDGGKGGHNDHRDNYRKSNNRDRITPGHKNHRDQKTVHRPSVREMPKNRIKGQTASRGRSSHEEKNEASRVSIRKVGIR